MQVFHPFYSTLESVKCLDNKRLGKQRIETIQILLSNLNIDNIWKIPKYIFNHPVTSLWRGYENYLFYYLWTCINEWSDRGFKNEKCNEVFDKIIKTGKSSISMFVKPDFIDNTFIKKQRLNLLQKNKDYYIKFFKEEV